MPDVLDLPVRALFATDASRVDPPTPGRDGSGDEVDGAETLLHGAVFAMAARELAGLVRALPLERVAAALRDRDPAAAVGGLLADAALAHAAAATEDPLTVALLRGARRKRELLTAAGGSWSTGTVAEHLGITRQGVDKRRQAGTLLGVRLPSGDWGYPGAQFGPDGAPLPGLTEALGAFRSLESPWMRLEHLLTPDPALRAAKDGGPRSALQALREDGPAAVPAIVASLQQAGDPDA